MIDNVIPLRQEIIGDGVALSPEDVLESAKGHYELLVIVGRTAEGKIEVASSHGALESLMLLAWAQQFLVLNNTDRGV